MDAMNDNTQIPAVAQLQAKLAVEDFGAAAEPPRKRSKGGMGARRRQPIICPDFYENMPGFWIVNQIDDRKKMRIFRSFEHVKQHQFATEGTSIDGNYFSSKEFEDDQFAEDTAQHFVHFCTSNEIEEELQNRLADESSEEDGAAGEA